MEPDLNGLRGGGRTGNRVAAGEVHRDEPRQVCEAEAGRGQVTL